MACNTVDPVEYNDALVTSADAATRAQDAFANSLGTSGDTMQVNFNKMNTAVDKAIADVEALQDYEDGKEYKAEVLRYLMQVKNQNNGAGREIMVKIQDINRGTTVLTKGEMAKLANQMMNYDNMGLEGTQKITTAQNNYAKKTGIKVEARPSGRFSD